MIFAIVSGRCSSSRTRSRSSPSLRPRWVLGARGGLAGWRFMKSSADSPDAMVSRRRCTGVLRAQVGPSQGAELVGKAEAGEVEALGEVIEGEGIEDGDVADDVDDRASTGGGPDGLSHGMWGPRESVEEAPVAPSYRRAARGPRSRGMGGGL